MGAKGKSKYDGKYKAGDTFGHWSVVDGRISDSPAAMSVSCVCGNTKKVDVYSLVKGKSTSCGCVRVGENAPNWKGVNGLSHTTLATNMSRAIRSGWVHTTPEQLGNIYAAQSGNCMLTGFAITGSATLARFDNSKPYEVGNVTWVHPSVAPLAVSYGVSSVINTSNAVVSNTSQTNNIFEKLGFKPNGA